MPAPAVHKVTSEFLSFMTPANGNLYLIALNYTLPRPTLGLWSTATFRICADGGANRLYDEMGTTLSAPKRSVSPIEGPLLTAQALNHLHHITSSQEPGSATAASTAAQPLSRFKVASTSSGPSHVSDPNSDPHFLSPGAPYSDLTAASLDLMAASLDLNSSHANNLSIDAKSTHPAPSPPHSASTSNTYSPADSNPVLQTVQELATVHQTGHPAPPLPPLSDENTCASDVSEADSSVSGIPEVSSTSMHSSGGAAHVQLLQPQQRDPQLHEQEAQRGQLLLPDLIQGDMDSIRADVLDYYTRHGVPHRDLRLDQDSTDLMKCLHFIQDELLRGDPEPTRHTVLVLGAIGGRLDHTLSNLGVLHMFPSLSIVLWGDGNLVRLLPPGRSVITPDQRFEGPKCGLVPICGGITATTTGLKWNCDNLQLKVGGLLSTSNELAGGDVCVETDGPVLWMTEVSDQAVMCSV